MPEFVLAKILKRKKLSKRQYAKRLNEEYRFVFRYFRKGFNPTFKTMCRLAAAVPCKVRDLIQE